MLGPLLELIPQMPATLQSLGKDRPLGTHDESRGELNQPPSLRDPTTPTGWLTSTRCMP